MNDFQDDNFCFVCGQKNQRGLKIDFSQNKKAQQIELEVSIPRYYQGWQNFIHGGIISTLLDEAMIKAAALNGFKCITAELNVRFKKPARVETPLLLSAKVVDQRSKIVNSVAQLQLKDGTILAEGSAILFKV